VARRKYGTHSPATSTAGFARGRDPSGDTSLQEPLEPRAEYGKPPPESASEPASEPQHFQTSLIDQLRQQRQDQLDAYIAQAFPGSMPHERQWLRERQHYLANPMLVHQAAKIAFDRGIPRQDPQFLQFVGQLLDQHHAAMQAQAAPAPTPPVPPPMPPPAHMHVDVEKTESPEDEPESEQMAVHHVSAPVSRGAEHYSGDYEPGSDSRVHLSKAEREHAEAAGVSVEEYGRQKLRMMKMKKAKLIRDE
jgi:hypothetical protein